ncbi:ATP-binding protein [Arthrobacter sp. LAPM80]|uniref:ATP-binding protein n=1 Tax=Arthrobacter sp. LAPM80 TaxID=3141788 RepID=UPI00398A66A3
MFFQLVASRYERASLILTSNLAASHWADVFGDAHDLSNLPPRRGHQPLTQHLPPPRPDQTTHRGPILRK